MSYEHIAFSLAGGIATIRFDRPTQLNASSQQLLRETLDVLYRVENMNDVGAVVVTGTGAGFNSGFDLKEIPLDGEGTQAIDFGAVVPSHGEPAFANGFRRPPPTSSVT